MTITDSTVRTYSVGDHMTEDDYRPRIEACWTQNEGYGCNLPPDHKGSQHVAAVRYPDRDVVHVWERDTVEVAPNEPKRYAKGEIAPLSIRASGEYCGTSTDTVGHYYTCSLPAGHDGPQHLTIDGASGEVISVRDIPEPIVEQPTPEVVLATMRTERDNLDRLARDRGAEIDRLNERMETFRKQVVKVARQKAREHDWCSVVDQALREMGLGDVEYERRFRVTTDVWIEHGSWEARQEGIEVVVESTRGAADAWRDVDGANEEQAIDMLNAAGIYVPDGWEFSRFDASTGYADVVDED